MALTKPIPKPAHPCPSFNPVVTSWVPPKEVPMFRAGLIDIWTLQMQIADLSEMVFALTEQVKSLQPTKAKAGKPGE